MSETAAGLRNAILALFALGSLGSLVELLLLDHYEDAWQYAPLVIIALAAAVITGHLLRPTPTSLLVFQFVMVLFVVTGLFGVWLHFEGAAEFQREIDPSMSASTPIVKALKSKAPPVLAPGLLSQLGLLGFAYSFRNPVLSTRGANGAPDTTGDPS